MNKNKKTTFINGVPLRGTTEQLFEKLNRVYPGSPRSRIIAFFAELGAEKLRLCPTTKLTNFFWRRSSKGSLSPALSTKKSPGRTGAF